MGDARDRGSVLFLVPAAFLVVLILASIAVDMSVVQLRQRQAFDFAAGAANDAAGAGGEAARNDGGPQALAIDPVAARRLVGRELAASELAPLVVGEPSVRVAGDQIEVSLRVRARFIFARAIPGAAGGMTVTGRATARAAAG